MDGRFFYVAVPRMKSHELIIFILGNKYAIQETISKRKPPGEMDGFVVLKVNSLFYPDHIFTVSFFTINEKRINILSCWKSTTVNSHLVQATVIKCKRF